MYSTCLFCKTDLGAEEIAGISDNLFLPSEISTRLTELKRDVK